MRWGLLLLAVLSLLATPFLGAESVSPSEILRPETTAYRIFWFLRLPRALVSLSAGGVLAALGAVYQILFHNPLAEPYVLGVSSAATLGIALAEVIAIYGIAGQLIGFGSAMVLTALLVALCLSRWGRSMDRIILFGMGLNFVLSSILFLVLSFANQTVGGGSMRWLFGQIPWVTQSESLMLAGLSLAFLAWLWAEGRKLDALSLGDGVAATLGVSPRKARTRVLFLTSALLAILVGYTGSIGFVGLVIPHLVKLLFHPGTTRKLVLYSFGFGAVFLLWSDVLARVIYPPLEFPIGILTTLIGGPLFLFLLWRRS